MTRTFFRNYFWNQTGHLFCLHFDDVLRFCLFKIDRFFDAKENIRIVPEHIFFCKPFLIFFVCQFFLSPTWPIIIYFVCRRMHVRSSSFCSAQRHSANYFDLTSADKRHHPFFENVYKYCFDWIFFLCFFFLDTHPSKGLWQPNTSTRSRKGGGVVVRTTIPPAPNGPLWTRILWEPDFEPQTIRS